MVLVIEEQLLGYSIGSVLHQHSGAGISLCAGTTEPKGRTDFVGLQLNLRKEVLTTITSHQGSSRELFSEMVHGPRQFECNPVTS
jgi:hypothetical protein